MLIVAKINRGLCILGEAFLNNKDIKPSIYMNKPLK